MEKRESEFLEFKKSTSELKEAVISLVSMLNKNGKGTVYFGVLNNGDIFGQQIGKNTTHDISVEIKNHVKPNIVPSIEIVKYEDKSVIKIDVEGNDKPYSAYERYYLRSDDEDLSMDGNKLEEFFINKSSDYSLWENTNSGFDLSIIDEELLINYLRECNNTGRLKYIYKDVESSLKKLGLYNNNILNNAGYYLFSNNKPLKLKLAVFNSDERISFSDIKLFEGNIFECINEGIAYISSKMKWHGKIEGSRRIETPEIPLEAIREIVVNSFAHMKVSPSIFNEIYLTPNKIVIRNPGSIYKNINPEQFANGEKGPILRNPLIDLTLYKNGTIDSFATGFERTFRLCKQNGIQYQYINDPDSFTFIFKRNNDDTINDTINDTKENRNIDIVKYLEKNPQSTRKDMSKKLNVSEPTISRALKLLSSLHLIERVGANKNGYWKVVLKDKM